MYDLRGCNNKIGAEAKAYRLNPYLIEEKRERVLLLDEYDIHSALILGYDILVVEMIPPLGNRREDT